MSVIVITGTDTDVGKTVFAAALTAAVDGVYWKPVQAGRDGGTDTETVARLSGLPAGHVLPERHVLSNPLSPHRAAELDDTEIDDSDLILPVAQAEGRPLIVEGAGGALVPVNRRTLFADVFARWRAPVVICARTGLGTINHSLMTVEVLRQRDIPILGIAFIGDSVPDTERTIPAFAGVKRLGRLPVLSRLDRDSLREAFFEHFTVEDFLVGHD